MNEWNTYRVKDVAKFISEKANDYSLPYIALDNIVSWDGYYIPSDSTSDGNSNVCKKGDVLFGKLRPYLAKGYIPTQDSICSPEFIVLRPNDLINNSFLLYYLLSSSFVSYIKNQVAGVKMPRTNALQIGRVSFALPPIEEQGLIVSYLDKECDKITREIDLLERKADCYRHLRRSLINRTVTRGLDPNVPLKPSGSDWIGDIPQHWNYERVGKYFHNNTVYNKNFQFKHAFKFFKGTIILKDEFFEEDEYQDAYEKYTIVEQNDIVINGLNLNYDFKSMRVGKVSKKGIITSAYIILRPYENVYSSFFNYLFKSFDYRKFFHGMGKGVRLTLSFNDLRTLEIPIPPLNEQREITEYLDENCSKIDSIIEKIELKIERLKELKRSLINEVVTGRCTIKTSDL